MRGFLAWLAACAVLGRALVACSSSSSPAAPGDGDAAADGTVQDEGGAGDAGPPTPTSACEAYIRAVCARRAQCQDAAVDPRCGDLAALCPDYFFSPGSTRTVEGTLACAKQYETQPCAQVNLAQLLPCSTPGTIPNGQGCAFSSQCASVTCSASFGKCGTCLQAPPAPGQGSGGVGAPCADSTDCGSPLFCVGAGGADGGACAALPPAGRPCAYIVKSGPGCEAPSYCLTADGLSGTCALPAQAGEPCSRDDAGDIVQCSSDLYCNLEEAPPRCRPPASEGQACGFLGATYVPCRAPDFCKTPTTTSGTCSAPAAFGESCAQAGPANAPYVPTCAPNLVCTPLDGGAVCGNAPTARRGEACAPPNVNCYPYFSCVDGGCVGIDFSTCSADASPD